MILVFDKIHSPAFQRYNFLNRHPADNICLDTIGIIQSIRLVNIFIIRKEIITVPIYPEEQAHRQPQTESEKRALSTALFDVTQDILFNQQKLECSDKVCYQWLRTI